MPSGPFQMIVPAVAQSAAMRATVSGPASTTIQPSGIAFRRRPASAHRRQPARRRRRRPAGGGRRAVRRRRRADAAPSRTWSSSTSDVPVRLAEGAIEGARHRAADPEDVDAIEEVVEHADLRRDLRAADDRHHRGARVVHDAAEHLELARHQLAGDRREQMRDALGRGVGAVRGAERVVDVHVGECGELPRERGIVGLLAGFEADVLEHADVTVAQRRRPCSARCRRRRPRRGARRHRAGCSGARRSVRAGALSSILPFGRPRCATTITRAPRARSASMVGIASRIRRSSMIAPSRIGTLRSSRRSTRLPWTSMSSMVALVSAVTRRLEPRGDQVRPGRRRGRSIPTRCRTRRAP